MVESWNQQYKFIEILTIFDKRTIINSLKMCMLCIFDTQQYFNIDYL